MTTESTFWKGLKGKLPREGHYSRVENPCDPGTPDVSFCLRLNGHSLSRAGWLELKYRADQPGPTTPILTEKHGVRPAQKLWIRKNLEAGGIVLILVGVADSLFFFHGRYAPSINGWNEIDYLRCASARVPRHDEYEVATAFRDSLLEYNHRF